jgi:hypothetical protein
MAGPVVVVDLGLTVTSNSDGTRWGSGRLNIDRPVAKIAAVAHSLCLLAASRSVDLDLWPKQQTRHLVIPNYPV